ncbi:MAG: chemotaxis protein CheW [Candidatus Obscuribacterales bacterium]|nr:chemotaxis protein CheW [Candidatus Obscuribacterales bacterium]
MLSQKLKDKQVQVLVFRIDTHRACFELGKIVQVYDSVSFDNLEVPCKQITGTINVRGQEVALVDLRSRWNLPARPLSLTDQLIVLSCRDTTVSIITDQVLGTRTYLQKKIFQLADLLPGQAPHKAIAESDGIMVLLDSDKLFNDEMVERFRQINCQKRK